MSDKKNINAVNKIKGVIMYSHLKKDEAEKIINIGVKFIKIIIDTIYNNEPVGEDAVIFENFSDDDWEKVKRWENRFKRCSVAVLDDIKDGLDSGDFTS